MSEPVKDPDIVSQLGRELADCRHRGLNGLDRAKPVEAPRLDRLASDYCASQPLLADDRINQIKRLLRDAVDAYRAQGDSSDADLVDELFFGTPAEGMVAGNMLKAAQDKRGLSESTFRSVRHQAFARFAAFLITFAAPAPSAPSTQLSDGESAPRQPHGGRRYRNVIFVAVAIIVLAGVGVLVWLDTRSAHRDSRGGTRPSASTTSDGTSTPERLYSETVGARVGANTYTNPFTIAHAGQRIPLLQKVQVSCKVRAPTMPSVDYWYLVQTAPWKNSYAPANSFLNGDPPNGPYAHDVDTAVPTCPPGTPPNP